MKNYIPKYYAQAISERRSHKQTFLAVSKKKNGEWGKPCKYDLYGSETPQDGVNRLMELNNKEFMLVEA